MKFKLLIILMFMMLVLSGVYFMGQPSIIGHSVMPEEMMSEEFGLDIDETRSFDLDGAVASDLQSLRVSGEVKGRGFVNIYLIREDGMKLLLYRRQDDAPSNRITGMVEAADEEYEQDDKNKTVPPGLEDKEEKDKKDHPEKPETPADTKKDDDLDDEGLEERSDEDVDESEEDSEKTAEDSEKDKCTDDTLKDIKEGESVDDDDANIGSTPPGLVKEKPDSNPNSHDSSDHEEGAGLEPQDDKRKLRLVPSDNLSEEFKDDAENILTKRNKLTKKISRFFSGKPQIRERAVLNNECIDTCILPQTSMRHRLVFILEPGTVFHLRSLSYTKYGGAD